MSQDFAYPLQPFAARFIDWNSRIERTCKAIAGKDCCFLPSPTGRLDTGRPCARDVLVRTYRRQR